MFLKKSVCSFILSLFSLPLFAFTLPNLAEQPFNVDQFLKQGQWTVVEIWSSHCGICHQHMPSMVEFSRYSKEIQILGISLDGHSGLHNAIDFVKQYQVPFPNLISNGLVVQAWLQELAEVPLNGTPTFLIFNPEGQLKAVQGGYVSVHSFENFVKKRSAQPKIPYLK